MGSSQIFELKRMVTLKRVVFNLDMKIMVDGFLSKNQCDNHLKTMVHSENYLVLVKLVLTRYLENTPLQGYQEPT